MTTTATDPIEDLLSGLKVPLVHHIDVCRDCKPKATLGRRAICRCGTVKEIEGYLPHPDWVSCQDCLRATQAACTFCGKPRKLGVY